MARRTQFKPTETPAGWRLNIPAKYTESGKRERHFFRTQAEALAAAKALKKSAAEFGHRSQAIRPSLAEDATAAAALLAPYGVSLTEAARIVAEMRQREAASRPLGEAADLWLVACEGLRDKTRAGYKHIAQRLKASLGDRLLATLTAEDLQSALTPPGTPATAAASYLRTGKAFWRWSAEQGWCMAETFTPVKPPKGVKESGEIEILTPEETAALLAVAVKHFPQTVPLFAVQLFAGVRAEEVEKLETKHVSTEGIDIPASVAKRGRRRHITPSATLAAWLEKFPFEPCANWRETAAAVRRLAGWDVSSTILNNRIKAKKMKALPDPSRGRWPQNALRHSHASYSVASGVPLESLLFEFGHTGKAEVLRQHYVGRASKKQALEYFAIMPAGVKAPATIKPVESVA